MRKVASVDGRDRRRHTRSLAQGAQPGRGAASDEGIQGHLGAQLRALYQRTLEEPVPERFLELLHRSDAEGHAPVESDLPEKKS